MPLHKIMPGDRNKEKPSLYRNKENCIQCFSESVRQRNVCGCTNKYFTFFHVFYFVILEKRHGISEALCHL